MLAIIIPCYNEGARLQVPAFRDFSARNPQVHFYFVNDGSRDNTAAVLAELCAQNPDQFFQLTLPRNAGKAEAVRQGMLRAAREQTYPYLGFLDADLSAPLNEILPLYAQLQTGNYLLVAGCRIKILGKHIERSTMRHYFSRIFATFYSNLLRLPNYDTQCGLKLFRQDIIPALFEAPFMSRWLFDLEIFLRTRQAIGKARYEAQIAELPLNEWKEVGASRLKWSDFIKAPLEVLKIYTHYKKTIHS